MSYRNKTYVIFDADEDMAYYRIMTAWKSNDNIDFDFHDAHELNNLRSNTSVDQIKRKLRERMKNSKQVIVLVGEKTKNLHQFVRWEIELAIELEIPIVAANIDKSNRANSKTPPILKDEAFFVSVPFGQKEIKHALDLFPNEFNKEKDNAPSSRYYSCFD